MPFVSIIFMEAFPVPEPYILKAGAKIVSLQGRKEDVKSDENENAFISWSDPPDAIARKLRRAVTDSDGEIRFRGRKPGFNLRTICSAVLTGKTIVKAKRILRGRATAY